LLDYLIKPSIEMTRKRDLCVRRTKTVIENIQLRLRQINLEEQLLLNLGEFG